MDILYVHGAIKNSVRYISIYIYIDACCIYIYSIYIFIDSMHVFQEFVYDFERLIRGYAVIDIDSEFDVIDYSLTFFIKVMLR